MPIQHHKRGFSHFSEPENCVTEGGGDSEVGLSQLYFDLLALLYRINIDQNKIFCQNDAFSHYRKWIIGL
jgi:hypothetical protein